MYIQASVLCYLDTSLERVGLIELELFVLSHVVLLVVDWGYLGVVLFGPGRFPQAT